MSPRPPDRVFESRDGTPIAGFCDGAGPPLLLVHGAAADHTTWRAVGPMLAARWSAWAIDRRGRGASGDAPGYTVEREFEDVRAAAEALAREAGAPVPVVGHSFGGRVALGAALRTEAIGRLVVYEGAPAPDGVRYQDPGLVERLRALPSEALLETFLRDVVGLDDADIAAYRANPVWPARVAAASTIARELSAETRAAAGLEVLGEVPVPVLLVLGSASRPAFHASTRALAELLPHAQVEVIEGAKHAAHHTHPEAFVTAVERFLAGSDA